VRERERELSRSQEEQRAAWVWVWPCAPWQNGTEKGQGRFGGRLNKCGGHGDGTPTALGAWAVGPRLPPALCRRDGVSVVLPEAGARRVVPPVSSQVSAGAAAAGERARLVGLFGQVSGLRWLLAGQEWSRSFARSPCVPFNVTSVVFMCARHLRLACNYKARREISWFSILSSCLDT